jgi:RNA polymerase sigma-70 factor (ECF subfamily)
MHPSAKLPDPAHRAAAATLDWPSLARTARAEARRWLRDPHDAEDAAQEALIRAWIHRDRCRRADVRPWLRQIVRHEVCRLADHRRAMIDREARAAALAAPADDFELADLRADLQRATGELPVSDRALLVARYGLDLTQPAAAALLGMPEGTAKVRLHRMRRKLALSL